MGVDLDLAVRIVEAVREGPLSSSDLALFLGVPRPLIERHISILETYGILRRRRRGLYSLSENAPPPDEVLSLVRSIEFESKPVRFKNLLRRGDYLVLDFGNLKLRLRLEDAYALHRMLSLNLKHDPLRQALLRLYWSLREGKQEFSGTEVKRLGLQACVKAGFLTKGRTWDPILRRWRVTRTYRPSQECLSAFMKASSPSRFLRLLLG